MLIFLLFWTSYSQCVLNQEKQTSFYKSSKEIIRLNLYDYFFGYNLYFENQQGYEIQNVINQQYSLQINEPIIDSAYYLSKLLILCQTYQSALIYLIDQEQLDIVQTLYIPQQQYQLYCTQVAFINSMQIVLSCYSNSTFLQFYFYTYTLDDQFSWKQLEYNPNITINNYVYFDLQTYFDANSTLFVIGAYTEAMVGVIEIYSLEQFSGTPIKVFNSYRSFQIFEQSIYLMNVTKTIQTYLLSNMSLVNEFETSFFADPQIELLAFNVLTANTLLVYINSVGENLYEITQNNITKKYIVRIDYQQTMVQLSNNAELIGLQIGYKYFIYDRIKPTTIINSQEQQLINLYPLITTSNNTIYNFQFLEPAIFINSTSNSTITIIAESYEESTQIECQLEIQIYIHGDSPMLQFYNKTLPTQVIVKKEITYINSLNYVSGSLLQLSAQTQQQDIFISNPSLQSQLSQQIWNQIGGVYTFYSADFNSIVTFILQYEYSKEVIKYSKISMRICDVSLLSYIDINELICIDFMQIFSLNAPMNKLEFTDLTDPDEIYFVTDIAHSAIIVYKLTQVNAFSQVQSEFLCEPLPIDKQGYQHQITDFYVIGSNLYLLLSRIQQIWVYEISTCDQIFIITNDLFDGPFYPTQISGITVIDELNFQRTILFINSDSVMYVAEVFNDDVQYKNKLTLESGNIINISVIKDTIILVIKDKQVFMQQYYYSINQPSNPIVFIKKLPQYGVGISDKYIMQQDSQLFFILMNNNYYYVYNPQLASSDCLIQQLSDIGDYISATHIPNILKQSNIVVASKTNLVMYSITNPTYLAAELLTDNYDDEKIIIKFNTTIQSPLCNNQINLVGELLAYNTLFKAQLNYEVFYEYNSFNQYLTVDESYYQFPLYLQAALQNNIIGYILTAFDDDSYTNINLIQPLDFQNFIPYTPNCNLMTFNPNSDIIYLSNSTQLFQLQNGNYTQLANFGSFFFTHCYDLIYSQQQLILICSNYEINSMIIYNLQNQKFNQVNFSSQTQFYFPKKIYAFNTFLAIQGIYQGYRDYSIIFTQFINNTYQMETLIQCQINNDDQFNQKNIADFLILQLSEYNLMIFTCPLLQQVQYITFTNNLQILNQSILHLETILPKKATLHELALISSNQSQIDFVLSTKEFYSFIISANYINVNQSYYQLTQVVTNRQIAPMQDSIMQKGLLYYNSFLFAVFYDFSHDLHFLALYDLGSYNNITTFYSIDAIVFDTPIQYTITGESPTLFIQESAPPLYQYNYSNQIIVELFNVEHDQLDLTLIIEQKYGSRQYLPLEFDYPSPVKTENWIKFTCIGIGVIYVLFLLGTIIFHGTKRKESEEQISLELNQR